MNEKEKVARVKLSYVGCAGWSIPKTFSECFQIDGSHLERYAERFNCVEINSSFYRPHRLQTYAKWAFSVPDRFRFAVKVPKSITHEHRLQDVNELLDNFLAEIVGLGEKLGPILIQLPPSLSFDPLVAEQFFCELRQRFTGQVVCESRHISWFGVEADELLRKYQVARVTADPALVPRVRENGGWNGLAYYRLHGSPIIYRSAYTLDFIVDIAARIKQESIKSVPTWCIFDNTAEGAAIGNALELIKRLQ